MTWKPKLVSTSGEISPGLMASTPAENSGTICSLANTPSDPPRSLAPGSSLFPASDAKFAGVACARIPSALARAAAFCSGVAEGSTFTRMWLAASSSPLA
jgi:hypothetical protein